MLPSVTEDLAVPSFLSSKLQEQLWDSLCVVGQSDGDLLIFAARLGKALVKNTAAWLDSPAHPRLVCQLYEDHGLSDNLVFFGPVDSLTPQNFNF